jgi:enoyl-CoA hydratase/carnithine racemase
VPPANPLDRPLDDWTLREFLHVDGQHVGLAALSAEEAAALRVEVATLRASLAAAEAAIIRLRGYAGPARLIWFIGPLLVAVAAILGGALRDAGTTARRRSGGGFIGALFNCRKPIIAALNGAAVGVGATLTLPMDIRIAARGTRVGFVFARRGLVPEAGSAWFLPRLVGLPTALRWCLSGALIPAEAAMAGGLVSEVVEPEALMDRAREIAREIAENTAPVSVALTRQMLWRFSGEPDPWGALKVDGAMAMTLGAGPDVREGVAAFLEKRSPDFPGKVSTDMPTQYPWWKD